MVRLTTTLVLVTLLGCGGEASLEAPEATPVQRSPLEATFAAAARDYQVPEGVLKAIGYVETRLSMEPGLESGTGGVGPMQLARRGDWDSLGEAARLTGVAEGRLKVDAHANVRGAAAVLRRLFERSLVSDPSLNANEVGDWFDAVSFYPGFESASGSTDYATDVFLQLEAGFEVDGREGRIAQAPVASRWRPHAPTASARRDAVLEYPGAYRWVASPHYSSGRSSYEFVLIHTMQGSYAGTLSWFQNTSSKVSTHYIVRSNDGQVTQMVEHRNTAWHAQCYNGRSIGIEHEGYVQDPARWYTDTMYRESAKLTRWIADRHGIPKTRARIIGHVEVPRTCNTGGHTDPGSGWNWTKYMSYVTGSAPTASTGVLIGAIYTGGSTSNRVAGAVVKVGSQTVTTGTDGVYQFTLAPGSYTASVTKSGFSTATVTRTVTSGVQTWGSMEVTTAAVTGTLRGKIYAANPADAADTSAALSGATVTTAGKTVTTAADGAYVFTLPPGTYTVNVTRAGYQSSQVSRSVTASTVTWGSVGLSSTASTADAQKPTVAFSFPTSDASLDLGRIEVKGTASDDRGPVSSVKLSLNGGAATDVSVTNGAFGVEVQLKPGRNTLEVTARDAAGNEGKATTAATFNAGVAGFVHAQDDASQRLEGATVELREASSGTVVSSVTTDASGAWFAPVMVVPADYLVVVKKTGYLTSSQTVSVPEEARLDLDVGLVEGQDDGAEASLSFVEPQDGATVTTDTVTLYGVARGFDLTGVTVNGVSGELLGAGGFSVTVPLAVGENVLEAVATGTTGQTVVARLTLVRVTSTPGSAGGAGSAAQGGCGCGALGFDAVALLGAVALLRRRRR